MSRDSVAEFYEHITPEKTLTPGQEELLFNLKFYHQERYKTLPGYWYKVYGDFPGSTFYVYECGYCRYSVDDAGTMRDGGRTHESLTVRNKKAKTDIAVINAAGIKWPVKGINKQEYCSV